MTRAPWAGPAWLGARLANSALARGALIAFAIQTFTAASRYLLQVLFARWGGAAQYGRYAYATTWAQLLVVPATIGFTLTVLRYVPLYIRDEKWDLLRGIVRRSSQISLLGATTLAVVASLVVLEIHPEGADSLLLGFWTLPVLALVNLQREIIRGTRNVAAAYGISDLLPVVLTIAAAIAASQAFHPLTGPEMLIMTIGALTVTIVTQRLKLHRLVPQAFRTVVVVYRTRDWVTVSVPLLLVTTFNLVMNQCDLLAVGIYKGARDAGLYSAANKTAYLVSFVLTAVSSVAAPMIVTAHASRDRDSLQRLLRSAIRGILWPSLILVAILMALAGQIMAAFGPSFSEAANALRVLAAGQFVNSVTGPVGYVLTLTGHQKTVAWVYAISATLDIATLAIVTPRYGFVGAAAASSCAIALANLWLYAVVRARFGFRLFGSV